MIMHVRGAEAGNAARRLTAAAVVAALSCILAAQAQEATPSARRLASMKADYKRPPPRPVENQALVDLGRSLFWDPRASASGRTACASCHYPYLGWSVTDPRSRNDSGKLTSRRTQALIAVGYAPGPI